MTLAVVIVIVFFILGLVVAMAIDDGKLSMIGTICVWIIGVLLAYGLWR